MSVRYYPITGFAYCVILLLYTLKAKVIQGLQYFLAHATKQNMWQSDIKSRETYRYNRYILQFSKLLYKDLCKLTAKNGNFYGKVADAKLKG